MSKKIKLSGLFILLLASTGWAQPTVKEVQPISCAAGVYMDFGSFPAARETGQVEKDTGSGYEAIASLSAPATEAMFYQRMQRYSLLFPDYYLVTPEMAANIWQLIADGKQDSVVQAGIPVVLLALNAAFIDTTGQVPAGTRYRIKWSTQSFQTTPLSTQKDAPATGQLVFYELMPAAEAIRAEWRLKNDQRPPITRAWRKRLGIDSSFTMLDAGLGYEATDGGDSLRVHLSDTTVLPGISYLYYLSGRDYLGRTTSLSDTVRSLADNRATVNGIPLLKALPAADSTGICLSWPALNDKRVRSIRVFRSPYYDSAYVQVAVLTPADTSWTDRSVALGANYYYQAVAQGAGDFSYPSPRIIGNYMNDKRLLPPQAVRIALQDSLVQLRWKYPTFLNLLGFRLYRSVDGHTFKPVSGVIAAQRDSMAFHYTDSSSTTLSSGHLYTYAVAAISRSYQESPLSGIAEINYRKRTVLPVPAQLRGLVLSDSTILLTWQDMRPADPAVSGYQVYRKPAKAVAGIPFGQLTHQPLFNINEYTDTLSSPGSWVYVVRSVGGPQDSSAFSQPVAIRVGGDKPLPPWRVRLYAQSDGVMIQWDGTLIPGIREYQVYRRAGSGQMQRLATVPAGNGPGVYTDRSPKKGELYFYYVTSVTNKQVESDRSGEVSIRLRQ